MKYFFLLSITGSSWVKSSSAMTAGGRTIQTRPYIFTLYRAIQWAGKKRKHTTKHVKLVVLHSVMSKDVLLFWDVSQEDHCSLFSLQTLTHRHLSFPPPFLYQLTPFFMLRHNTLILRGNRMPLSASVHPTQNGHRQRVVAPPPRTKRYLLLFGRPFSPTGTGSG